MATFMAAAAATGLIGGGKGDSKGNISHGDSSDSKGHTHGKGLLPVRLNGEWHGSDQQAAAPVGRRRSRSPHQMVPKQPKHPPPTLRTGLRLQVGKGRRVAAAPPPPVSTATSSAGEEDAFDDDGDQTESRLASAIEFVQCFDLQQKQLLQMYNVTERYRELLKRMGIHVSPSPLVLAYDQGRPAFSA